MFALKRYIYMFMYNMFVLLFLLLVNQNLCDTCIFADLSLKVPLDIMGLKKKIHICCSRKNSTLQQSHTKAYSMFHSKKRNFKKKCLFVWRLFYFYHIHFIFQLSAKMQLPHVKVNFGWNSRYCSSFKPVKHITSNLDFNIVPSSMIQKGKI